jgi:probable phosphoglycerate mutase
MFFLVRHAEHKLVDKALVGRMPNIHLTEAGREQGLSLAIRLSREKIAGVYVSPQERARQTADPIALAAGRPIDVAVLLDEIDFGEWTGRSFDDLDKDACWIQWNARRSISRPPGGESMGEAQARILQLLQNLHLKHPGSAVVLVSHADMIRAALLYHLGLSLDCFNRIEIAPASFSRITLSNRRTTVVSINETITP